MKSFFVIYYLTDFVRRVFPASAGLILILMDLIFLIFALRNVIRNNFKLRNISKFTVFLMICIFCYAILILISYNNSNLLAQVSSLRTYVLPIFVVLLAAPLYLDERSVKLFKQLVYLSFFIVFIQFFFPNIFIGFLEGFGKPLEHDQHSWGDHNQKLVSAFFFSSKRLARFILISYIFVRLYEIECLQKMNGSLWFYIVCMSIIYLSGSRESFFLFIVFGIILNFTFKTRLYFFIIVVFLLSILLFQPTQDTRISFMFSSAGDLIARIAMLLPIFRIDPENIIWFSYLGLGTYGQDTLFDPIAVERAQGLDLQILRPIKDVFIYNILSFEDSGVTKIYAELGLFGLIMVFVMWVGSLFKKTRYELVRVRMKISVVCLLVLILKSHQLLNDLFYMLCTYSLLLGAIKIEKN